MSGFGTQARAWTSPNSLENLLRESPASVLQDLAVDAAGQQKIEVGGVGGQVPDCARWEASVPAGSPRSAPGRASGAALPGHRRRSPVAQVDHLGIVRLHEHTGSTGWTPGSVTCTGSQVAPLSVLEKISRGVMVNNVLGGPTVIARLWMSGSVTPLVTASRLAVLAVPHAVHFDTGPDVRWSTGSTSRAVTLGMPTLDTLRPLPRAACPNAGHRPWNGTALRVWCPRR